MSPDCRCTADPTGASAVRNDRKQKVARAGSLVGLLTGVAAVLAPKCPMCIAGYLSLVGIGVGAAWIAPLLMPVGLTIAAASIVVSLRSSKRRTT